MSLVHVVLADTKPKRAQYAHSAHSKNYLLLEAVGRIATVKIVCEIAIFRCVFGEITVEKDNR
jgi:hypothetical protein